MDGISIIVCGGRNYADEGRVFQVLDVLHAERRICHVHAGGAKGADSLAIRWCNAQPMMLPDGTLSGNVPGYSIHYAEWRKEGRAAGPRRNARMLCASPAPTLVVAFPGGPGTSDMARQARKAGVEVMEVK